MTEGEKNADAGPAPFLELANGGGLLLRDPTGPLAVPQPSLRPHRLKLLPADANRYAS